MIARNAKCGPDLIYQNNIQDSNLGSYFSVSPGQSQSTATLTGTTANGTATVTGFIDSTYCPTAGNGSLVLTGQILSGTVMCVSYTINFSGMIL